MRQKLFLIFMLVLFAQTAFPWGHLGHQTIVKVAEKHLTPQAQEIIQNLLHHDLSDDCSWMDSHRTGEWAFTNHWHTLYFDKNLNYDPKEIAERGHNPIVRNVNLRNVVCKESQYAVVLNGLDDCCNIYDVNVKDCDWTGVKGGKRGNLCDSLIWTEGHYRDIHFDNLKVNGNVIESLADNLLPE